jgi:hypothetical protein
MPFPGPDKDAPPITPTEWGLLAIGALCLVIVTIANLL